MRTDKEIKEVTKRGEEFIKEHPTSMFGDDNVHDFKIFQKIVGMRTRSPYSIRAFIEDAYEDDDRQRAEDTLDWLLGDSDEAPY